MNNRIFYGQVRDNFRSPFQSLQPLLAISNPNLLNRAYTVLGLVACRSKVEVDNPSITKCPWIKPGSLVHLPLFDKYFMWKQRCTLTNEHLNIWCIHLHTLQSCCNSNSTAWRNISYCYINNNNCPQTVDFEDTHPRAPT